MPRRLYGIYLIVMALLAMWSLVGCSNLQERMGYEPTASPGWEIEKYEKKPFLARHQCNDYFITIGRSEEGLMFTLFGPPLIPFIPGQSYKRVSMEISFYGDMRQYTCPQIYSHGETNVANRIPIYQEPYRKDFMYCIYQVPIRESDFELQVSSENMKCDIPPLKIKHEKNWRYRPFFVPQT